MWPKLHLKCFRCDCALRAFHVVVLNLTSLLALTAILVALCHALLLLLLLLVLPLIQFPDSCNVAYVAGSWLVKFIEIDRLPVPHPESESPCAVDICIQVKCAERMPEIYVNLLNFI